MKRTVGLDELQLIARAVRERLLDTGAVKCAFPDKEVCITWSDGEDHEVILDVRTGEVTAGGGRGFHWPEGKMGG